jgi:flagellar protein FlbD
MILLTRLNGSQFYVNADHIQAVESTPDSHILLSNGQQYVVRESAEEIAELAIAYQQRARRGLGGNGPAQIIPLPPR